MITTANGGMVTLNSDGTFEYEPAPGFIGEDTFDYTIVDPSGATDTATVTLNVTPDNPTVNDPPSAGNDLIATTYNEPTTANLLDNDTDPEDDSVTITDVAGQDPTAGPITITDPVTGEPVGMLEVDPMTGETTFTPENDFVGTVEIPYTITDSDGNTDTGTLTLASFNTPPIAEDDINSTEANIPVSGNVLINDSDDNPDDDLTIVDPATGNAATDPVTIMTDQGGTVVISPDGSYDYTPPVDFVGEDTFTYTVTDEAGNVSDAEVSIEVRDLNQTDPTDPATFNNAPPVATDDEFSSFADTPLMSGVLSNDSDPDGDVVAIADPATGDQATGPQTITTDQGGTVTLNQDGTFEYTPPAGFIGEDSFDYTIVDPSGATDTATVTLNIDADSDPDANDDPEAGDDLAISPAGEPATTNLLDNDTDPNDPTGMNPPTITDVNGEDPTMGPIDILDENGDLAGTLEVDPVTGETTFTPEPDFVGTVQVPYTIEDGMGGTDTATLTLQVTDPAPEAQDDINSTELDVPVSGNVLLNDSDDNPNDTLMVVDPATGDAATGPVTIMTTGGGTVVINPDGSYDYTPAPGFTGEDSFDYSVIDELGKTDEATVSIEVRDLGEEDPADPTTIGNTAPIATDDEFTSFADMPLNSSVTSNDSDPDGSDIVIADPNGEEATTPQTITTDQGGTVTLDPDGTFEYLPPAGFIGEDSFDYTIVDPTGATDTATVTLSVEADPDPDLNANDDPSAGDDLVTTVAGEPGTTNLLDNDTDPNGETPTIIDVNGEDPTMGPIEILDENGDLAGTLEVDPITGETTFTPEPDFVGTVQVPYTIDDGMGGTDTATATFQVLDPVPEANDDINSTETDTPVSGNVLLNDSDDNPEDTLMIVDPATGEAATGPVTIPTTGGGTVVINPDGSYEYTPASGFVGEDTFDYTAIDEFGKTDEATVSIEVRDLNTPNDPDDPTTFNNTPPIATDDEFTLFADTTLNSNVTSNDTDPEGSDIAIADPTTGEEATTPQTITTDQGGTVTLNPDGTFEYLPPTGFVGEDSFDYTIVDPSGATDTATVTLNVDNDPDPDANDDPEAGNDLASAPAGEPATTNLLANDTDPNGDGPLTITDVNGQDPAAGPITITDPVTGEVQGMLEVDPITGEATFTPEPGFVGTVQVPYTVDDGNGGTDTGSAIFEIFDPAPMAQDDTAPDTDSGTPVTGNLLDNDSDENPDDLLTVLDPETGEAATSPVVVETTGGGTVVINPNGSYVYTPASGFGGEDSFEYTVIDEFGKTDVASFSIDVRPLATGNPSQIPGLGPIDAPLLSNQTNSSSLPPFSGVSPGLGLDSQGPIQGGFGGGSGIRAPQPILQADDNRLVWSLDDAPSIPGFDGRPVFTIDLNGQINAGQTASVQVVADDHFTSLDQQILAEAIAEAVESYDGNGELTFNGSKLSFTSADGTTMDPLAVTMPISSEEATPDEMIDLQSAENSEIAEGDEAESESSDSSNDSQDGEPNNKLISHKGDAGIPLLKRFYNWLSTPSDSVS